MSQAAMLRAMDAVILGSFVTAGMADSAWYLPADAAPDALPFACTVLVDRDVRLYDEGAADVAEVATLHTLVTLFRAAVTPARGGKVTLLQGEVPLEVLQLDQLLEQDESKSRWTVLHD